MMKHKMENASDVLVKVVLFLFLFILLSRAFIGPMWYDDTETGWVAEFDSVALPVISLQYRGSFFSNESDIARAREDFPILYEGVYDYEDLRANKLIQAAPDKWIPFYFPVYSFLCLPVKILFQLLNISQDRCFLVTNALLIGFALYMVSYKLKASKLSRMLALLLFILSPIYYYNNLVSYEACLFSLVTIGLVLYANGNRRSSAFVISVSGMMNTGILAVGIVMILEYLIGLFRKEKTFWNVLVLHWKETVQYALCFVPALVYPILQKIYLGNLIFSRFADYTWWGERIRTYLFDPSIGFPSFTMGIFLFFVIISVKILGGGRKDIVWLFFLVGSISLISLHYHINSGMIYCARYVMWTYPIIVIYLCTIGVDVFRKFTVKVSFSCFILLTSVMLLWGNHETALELYEPNLVTKWLLNNCPVLYNPYYATFYCRVAAVDENCYTCTRPGFYIDSDTAEIRKIIYFADPDAERLILNQVTGEDEGISYIKKQIEKHGDDGKYHYINVSPRAGFQIKLR